MKTKKSSMLFVSHDSSTLPHASEGGQFQIVENKENRITIDSSHNIHVDKSNLGTALTKIGEIVYTDTTVVEKIPVFATEVGTLPGVAPGTDILYFPISTDPINPYYPFKVRLPVYEQVLQTERYNQEVGFYIGGSDPQNIEDITLLSDPIANSIDIQYGCYGDVDKYKQVIGVEGIFPKEISKIEGVMVTSKDSVLDAYYCKK